MSVTPTSRDVRRLPGAPNCVNLSILWADARRTEEIAMVTVGLLVTLEAKPGKEGELASFLASALPLAQAEPETTAWFAIKVNASTFGIVDVFPDAAGRQAHLDGPIAAALMQRADELLASPPDVKPIDVLAAKLPT
jgi:quinol monooxygenase YgiN